MIKLIVFDLDGTVADTSEGILNSHCHALSTMGRPVPSDRILFNTIGSPLLETYRTTFDFSDEDAVKAVQIYRDWYAEHGIHQAKLYPGMDALLRRINERGLSAGVATLKAEPFAMTMMDELGVGPLFRFIYGMNGEDTLTKAELIGKCMAAAGASPEETCMVGDSIHDYNGAKQCSVPFIGVSYGFGFRSGEERPFPLCGSPEEIGERLRLM